MQIKNKDQPIVEGYTFGVAILIYSSLLVALTDVHLVVVLFLYIIGFVSVGFSFFWQRIEEIKFIDWLVKKPTRFFVIGFAAVAFTVLFLDFFYLKDREGVLVEAHGLLFDLLLFGIILTSYDMLRRKKEKTERYHEELEDYRGWTENEAAYRVAGLLKRLQNNGVDLGKKELENLHLGQCSREIIVKTVTELKLETASLEKAKVRGADLQEANLNEANLQEAYMSNAYLQKAELWGANLQKANLHSAGLQEAQICFAKLQEATMDYAELQEANLRAANLKGASLVKVKLQKAILNQANLQETNMMEANLQGADLSKANLKWAFLREANLKGVDLTEAKVGTLFWIEELRELQVRGADEIAKKYYIEQRKDIHGDAYFIIFRKRQTGRIEVS